MHSLCNGFYIILIEEDEALEWFKKAKEKGIKEIDETSGRYYPKSVDDWIKRAGAWAPRR